MKEKEARKLCKGSAQMDTVTIDTGISSIMKGKGKSRAAIKKLTLNCHRSDQTSFCRILSNCKHVENFLIRLAVL